MDLKKYFYDVKGMGVLSTADARGKVNAAVYSRPHVLEDGTLGFIMAHRLTHANLESNPSAVYLFKEQGPGWGGKRLYLRKVGENDDSQLIESMRRRRYSPDAEETMSPLHLVIFEVETERPLVGA